MSLLIQHGDVMDEKGRQIQADIFIENQKIAKIGANLQVKELNPAQIIDARGLLVIPGLVDLHVHLREPGPTYKETIASGTKAAAAGGYTSVCAMPNVQPVPDSVEHLQPIKKLIQEHARINVYSYAAITENLNSARLVDQKDLYAAGAVAFTNDGLGVQDAGVMYKAMLQAAKNGCPLAAHTEDDSLVFGGVMHEGKRNKELGLPGIVKVAESAHIARDIMLAHATGAHYHVCHISTKESVELVRQAKKYGIRVTAEVTPHHLILCEEDVSFDHGQFKMNPPLRATEDREALIQGLLDGTIDCIATDHAPHAEAEKDLSMRKAAFGIIGSELAFSLMYTELVQKGILTLPQLIDKMSRIPAQLFHLPAGKIEIGAFADLAIFNLDCPFTVTRDSILSKGKNTPFIGKSLFASNQYTVVRGNLVWAKGEE